MISMKETVDQIIKIAQRWKPDQVEAYWSRNKVMTVRMALNDIVEAKTMMVEGASVRFVLNKSIGFASTTELSNDGLTKMVEASFKASRSKSDDPDFHSLPEPVKIQPLPECDKMLMELDLSEAVKLGYEALETTHAEGRDLDFSGAINIVSEECAIRNSLGVDATDMTAFIFSSFTVEKSEERSAIGQDCSRTLKAFNPAKTAREAIGSIRRSKGGITVEPGTYDVILGPRACAELVEYVLSYGLDLSAMDSGMSYFRGRLGDMVSVKEFTVLDDGRHPEGIASKSIDDEGVPTGTTPLIENGVLRNFLCDSYYAAKMSSPVRSFKPTGNGFRFGPVPGRDYSSLPHIQPTNLVIRPGDQGLEEMIQGTKRGILLGRIWYSYPVNPTMGEFSTTNRGDTYYIEDGEARASILPNSFRINDQLPRLLKQIQGLGREQTQSVVWGGVSSCFSPHIKFGDVKITYSKV
jgi:PmbA protein